MRRAFAVLVILAVLMQPGAPQARAAQSEFRAYWVDAFGEGIYTEAQITKLVAQTKAANLNALVVQVGRRGDCFCNRAMMPRTQQAGVTPPPYDPLDTLIAKAHAEGIQVHAWIITTAIWNFPANMPPANPNHVFNLHGPSKKDADPETPDPDYWLSERYDGANRAGADYLLDPGHPDAADYMVRMYTSVAANYDIDGLNFDRVRLPDQNLTTTFPGVSAWGYNQVAVGRFQQLIGAADDYKPAPNDARWLDWRREQITNIVRKVYVETYAIKPHVVISADTITYGYGPVSVPGGWEATRTYREVLQDWRGWMEEGILDLNVPMNYKREHFTTEPNNQRRMYLEWNEFARDHTYARQVAIGTAIYLNLVENSVIQVRKALTPNANGNGAIGWVGYSYRSPDCLSVAPFCGPSRSTDASRAELTRALTQPSEYDAIILPVFSSPATVPTMPWKTAPARGHLAGTVTTTTGTAMDQILVDVRDAETDALIMSRLTDGLGYAAFVDLAPGRYKVFVPDDARVTGRRVELVDVSAGAVARFAITPFAKGNEGRRPPKATTAGFDPMEEDLLPNGAR